MNFYQQYINIKTIEGCDITKNTFGNAKFKYISPHLLFNCILNTYFVAYYSLITIMNFVLAWRPVAASLQPAISNITFRTTATEDRSEQILEPAPRIQNRSTQTDYRESESQTAPWAPPVFTHCSSTPEVLTLANLSWGMFCIPLHAL
jgi:hypothetical protein